ncbi:transcriptional regulator [Marinicauda salina]|uniref:Transcriptional regulator n=2 Tax=Marinicauda salina TaxID=2135793 RepID=A0A2U2BV11_9PROT|nr:transcriptional regulator [Marinicauda salina]
MEDMTTAPPVSVALLAAPESSAAVLYGLQEVLGAVGHAWDDLTGEPSGERRMRPVVVSTRTDTFRCPTGAPIAPDERFDAGSRFDVVIVGDLGIEREPAGRWLEECAWLRTQAEAGAMICSVCTGSVMLAEAGLLDGLEATTHWSARDIFARFYPAVRLHPERVLCPAGPEHRIVTSGGSAAWADLALYLIARWCGREAAIHIAKVFVLGDRSDGQLPFAAMSRPRDHDDAAIMESQVWIADNYALPNAVARMVEASGLAPRTFKRRFRAATGYTPMDYVQTLRAEEAKQLLETTDEPTDAIAEAVGYEDPASLRRMFKRLTGVTPARYRQRYRAIGVAVS